MCLGSPTQAPPCCLSQQLLPKAMQGLGSPIVVIPALPWGVPARPVPVVCGRQREQGLLQAHGMVSTASFSPFLAPCWDRGTLCQGGRCGSKICRLTARMLQGWPEAARPCLSSLTEAAWLSAGAGPAPVPRAAGGTGRARPVAVLGPESQQAHSGRLWGMSQPQGGDAGGSRAAGLGKFGMVTNAATKGRVTLTPHPALTHVAVAPVP